MAAKADAAEKTNTVDPERMKKVIAAIESAIDAKLSHKMEYVESCKKFNEAVADAYEQGRAFAPKKVLKAKIKERELKRKIASVASDLEDGDLDTFQQISQALGDYADTPLGKAATGKAKGEEDRDLRPRHLLQGDVDRAAAAANADKLSVGIKPLN